MGSSFELQNAKNSVKTRARRPQHDFYADLRTWSILLRWQFLYEKVQLVSKRETKFQVITPPCPRLLYVKETSKFVLAARASERNETVKMDDTDMTYTNVCPCFLFTLATIAFICVYVIKLMTSDNPRETVPNTQFCIFGASQNYFWSIAWNHIIF